LKLAESNNDFYEPGCSNTMILSLRRTLIRSDQ